MMHAACNSLTFFLSLSSAVQCIEKGEREKISRCYNSVAHDRR